jgi:hypothetical protein
LSKVEASHPGFSYDLILGLVRKADAGNVNMNESLLRLQGAVSDQDCKPLFYALLGFFCSKPDSAADGF